MFNPVSGSRRLTYPSACTAEGSPVAVSPSMWQTTQSHLVTVPAGTALRLCDQARANSGVTARRLPVPASGPFVINCVVL